MAGNIIEAFSLTKRFSQTASYRALLLRPFRREDILAVDRVSLQIEVYYPIEVLPQWLQTLSRLLPATYSLDALRRTMLRSASLSDVGGDLLALAAFALVLLPIGLLAFRYAVRWAKSDGSLSEY